MSTTIDTIRTDDRATEDRTTDDHTTDDAPTEEVTTAIPRKTLDVSDVDPARVTAYARATAAEGHPELYFERKGGRTVLIAR